MADIENGFKKYFIAIWIISLMFFGMELILGFAANWIIKSINYLYVVSLISLFIKSDLLTERTVIYEKFINLKDYDVWGLLLIIIGVTTFLLYFGLKSSVILIIAAVTLAIAVWIIIKYRKSITKPIIIKGLIIGILSAVAQYNYLPSLAAIFITIPFFYISASLLNDKFKVTVIHFNSNSYDSMIKSFLVGCLFSLPMALSNLSDVMTTNPYNWIDQFWKPILAFNFVLLEETFMRLFIITFIYVLVISKTDRKIVAVITAILISSTIFGLTHYPQVDIQSCINIAILYGLPLGVLFYKRDFETVVGYHFMINFVSAVSTYSMT
jgi:hypothetical protein